MENLIRDLVFVLVLGVDNLIRGLGFVLVLGVDNLIRDLGFVLVCHCVPFNLRPEEGLSRHP